MIYTTYFSNLRALPSHIKPIVVSRSAPASVRLPTLHEFAPPARVLADYKRTGDWDTFAYAYTLYLEGVDPHVLNTMDDVALVCWEKDYKHCHRYLLGLWLSERLGVPVKEWGCAD